MSLHIAKGTYEHKTGEKWLILKIERNLKILKLKEALTSDMRFPLRDQLETQNSWNHDNQRAGVKHEGLVYSDVQEYKNITTMPSYVMNLVSQVMGNFH
jgi:hypothetical protein